MKSPIPDQVKKGTLLWPVKHFASGQSQLRDDRVVVEEPLEIKLEYGNEGDRKSMSLSVTMRTPGDDHDLSTGFLYTEGIIKSHNDIISISSDDDNLVRVSLSPGCHFSPGDVTRHFYASSSCGVCGKASIDMVRIRAPWILKPEHPKVGKEVLSKLAQTLRKAQEIFAETGGLHAAGLFKPDGSMILSREDVGRHNALDKLIGRAMLTVGLPLSDYVCVVSGRAGFELVQKAWMAGFPVFAAVGAPSSLAVELADLQNMTLIGFLRSDRWNIYADTGRMQE